MRETPRISVEELKTCLEKEYGLVARVFTFLGLGLNYNAGVYRVEAEDGRVYALKVTRGPFYGPSCQVPAYLFEQQGIASVAAPLRSKRLELWASAGSWTLALYPFLVGTTEKSGMTDAHWRQVGATFRRIHQAEVSPISLTMLRRETFQPSEYMRQALTFEERHLFTSGGDALQRALRSSWREQRATLYHVLRVLETLAELLRRESLPYVICHADLHEANLLRTVDGEVFVLDWDDVMLAPKERDFLFVGEPAHDGAAGSGASPFFQGYGQTQIHWAALAYYRYERVAQDLLVCAQNVFEHEELGSGERSMESQLFQEILANGETLVSALSSLNYLPLELRLYLHSLK